MKTVCGKNEKILMTGIVSFFMFLLLTIFMLQVIISSANLNKKSAILLTSKGLTLSSIYSFQHIEEKSYRKTLWKKVKLLKMAISPLSTMFFMQSVS